MRINMAKLFNTISPKKIPNERKDKNSDTYSFVNKGDMRNCKNYHGVRPMSPIMKVWNW